MNNKLQLKRMAFGVGGGLCVYVLFANLCDERKSEFKLSRPGQLTSLKKFKLFLQNLYRKNITE